MQETAPQLITDTTLNVFAEFSRGVNVMVELRPLSRWRPLSGQTPVQIRRFMAGWRWHQLPHASMTEHNEAPIPDDYNVTADDMLSFVCGKQLRPGLRQKISETSEDATSFVAKWIESFREKCNHPLSVDYKSLDSTEPPASE